VLVDFGYYLLQGLVLVAAWATCAYLASGVLGSERWLRVGRTSILLFFAGTAGCSLILLRALLHGDFSVAYVNQVTEKALPLHYKFTAFWAGMDGSMLMWLLFLAAYAALALTTRPPRDRPLEPWMGVALSATVLFFACLVAFLTNPLERLPMEVADGRGMNPALQNYWMAIHPPTLYLGYVGLVVPFAFAIGALVSGRLNEDWIRSVRPWVLWPWLCLGLGMIFGGHWAYVELGWGGYWAWDPVENASFLPWLAATAYLHSVMVQERRGMFKAWNVTLILAAFALSIFGTFLTRSGVVESVHSFARSSVGAWFLGFVALIIAAAVGLLYWRWPLLKSPHRIDSLLSREFSFMLNNVAFVAILLSTLFLTMYAPISELVTGDRRTVGAPGYTFVNGSLGMVLLALTGIGPVISWRRASARSLRRSFMAPVIVGAATAIALLAMGIREVLSLLAWSLSAFVIWCILAEFHAGARVVAAHRGSSYPAGLVGLVLRNRRRYGGYVVHLAVVMFFIGVAGMAFRQETEAVLAPGQSLQLRGYTVVYDGARRIQTGRSDVDQASLRVVRDGEHVAELVPEFKVHHKFPEPEKDVSVHETLSGDLYAILAEPIERGTDRAKIQVLWNPLVAWVWWSSWLLLAGSAICMWPAASAARAGAQAAPPREAAA
jgi:cytochrome c-type biogenesis protein CcmF